MQLGQCVLFLFLGLLKFRPTLLDLFTIFITAHRKASFASSVYALGGISVCLSHSGFMSKPGDAEGCSLYHRVTQCIRFSDAKNG